jgi:hypothetical protein
MNGRSKFPVEQPAGTEAVRAQLRRILESTPFRTSKRCSDFLRYVVEGTCDGRSDFLKERTLGVAVFEREPDYDTNQDPVVRNTAGQVRKRLAQYYCEPGRDRELRIDLPPGSYVPEMNLPAAGMPDLAEPVAAAVEPPVRSRPWMVAVSTAAAMIAIAAIGFFSLRHAPTDVDLFWEPMLKFPGPLVLCVGQGHTYKLKGDLDRLFENGSGAGMAQGPASGSIPMSDVVPAWDRYVGMSDAQTLVRFAGLFSSLGKDVTVRGGRASTLSDLRGKPSVLIGAFNNDWTLSLTGELRFYFEDDAENRLLIRDRQHPENRSWSGPKEVSGAPVSMDYAIVSRVFNHTTEQPVVVAAGIRGGGTQAAGELLTNPAYLKEALKKAPAHWERGNVQFVIATKMFSGMAGPPEVVAAHYW